MNLLKLENDNSENKEQVVELIHSTVNDADLLVNELLEIHKIESGVIDKNIEPCELIPFVHQLVSIHQVAANKKNINININPITQTTTINTDKRILQRVLENLLTNAIKFSPQDSSISFTVELDDGWVWFSVKDQGAGIPKAEHSQLFTKFGKTSIRPTAGEPSTGLGLYIVDRLVGILGGVVSFTSEEGAGSVFTVSFPVK
jgi:signal transduction histidine kinase